MKCNTLEIGRSRQPILPIARALALSVVLFVCAVSVYGQEGRASINGTVVVQSGAVVAGAKIVASSTETGQARQTTSTDNGTYSLPLLPVGKYTVSATHSGFKTESHSDVVLTADQKSTVDFSLTIGEVAQTVEVSATTQQINTTNGAIGDLITEKAIIELPLNGRNPAELVFLAPGAIDGLKSGAFTRQGYTTFPTESGASVNGGRQGSTYYMLDGANSMDNYHNLATPFPNSDATQEFRVLTNNFDAEYGFSPGAVVSIVTRSGSNTWHGDAFEFLRNDKLNAADFFAKQDPTLAPGKARDSLKRNQFGGSIGGPIVKDKFFIFGNYQGTTERRTVNGGGTANVANDKMIAGDFSDVCSVAGGTFTAGICSNAAGQLKNADTGLPYLNNQIDPATFSPVAMKFESLALPHTTDPTGLVRLSGRINIQNYQEFTIKPDWYVSANHHISGRAFYDNFSNPKFGGANILVADRSWTARYQNYAVNWLYTIRPNLFNNLVVSYNRLNTFSQPGFTGKDGKPVCFACYGVKVNEYPTTPANLMLWTNGFGATQNTNFVNRHNVSLAESVSWNKGKHMFVGGVDVLNQSWDLGTDWLADEIIGFSGQFTGSDYSDFLLGKANFFWQGAGSFDRIKGSLWAPYAQDSIRLKPNLTLNVGMRWEPYFAYVPSKGRIPAFRPGQQSTRYPNSPVGLVFAGDTGVPAGGTQNNLGNFSPRLSIAWQPKALPNTSIRTAFGVFVAPLAMSTYNHVADTAPFAPSYQINPSDAGGKYIPFADPWSVYAPTGNTSPFPPFAATGFAPGPDVKFIKPVFVQESFARDFVLGKVQTWNFSVEHQFRGSVMGRVAYVGTEGYHLPNIIEWNPGFYNAAPALNGKRLRYSDFTSILNYTSVSTSSYNGLQLTFEKKFSDGLQVTSNYTWSKNIDTGSVGQGVFSGQFSNPFNVSFSRGISDINFPKIWTTNWVYQTPLLRQTSPVVRGVFGDWQLSGVWRLQSGIPFGIGGGNGRFADGTPGPGNISGTNIGGERADLTGQPFNVHQGSRGQWLSHYFNAAAFQPALVGTFGNSARNLLQGPGTNVADLGISKNFPFKERYRVQFRWEMFNAFNRPHFGNPGTNPSSPGSFGRITSTLGAGAGIGGSEQDRFGIGAREMQVALKLYF